MEPIVNLSLLYGAILSVVLSVMVMISLRINAEIWAHDYPPDVKAKYGPISERSRRQKNLFAALFFAVLAGVLVLTIVRIGQLTGGAPSFFQLAAGVFIVAMMFNLVDLLVLDWLILGFIQPSFVILPGTEGMAGYKDYGFAFRGFLTGTVGIVAASLVIAGIAFAVFRLLA